VQSPKPKAESRKPKRSGVSFRQGRCHMRRVNVLFTLMIATAVFGMRQLPAAQTNELSAARVTHIGVVVPDIDKAIQQYVRVMGFRAPKVAAYPTPMPDGARLEFKSAALYMPNFFIELEQPVMKSGPFYAHLQD